MDRNLTVNEQNVLRVLELVEERDKITQRGVAMELEIAVGMANTLIKRLVHKGYIKIKEAPSRRYSYYITPEGFMEKGRLVSKYIANSFQNIPHENPSLRLHHKPMNFQYCHQKESSTLHN